jgi:hypothetical protein
VIEATPEPPASSAAVRVTAKAPLHHASALTPLAVDVGGVVS